MVLIMPFMFHSLKLIKLNPFQTDKKIALCWHDMHAGRCFPLRYTGNAVWSKQSKKRKTRKDTWRAHQPTQTFARENQKRQLKTVCLIKKVLFSFICRPRSRLLGSSINRELLYADLPNYLAVLNPTCPWYWVKTAWHPQRFFIAV